MANNNEEPCTKKVRGKGKLGFLNDLQEGEKFHVELYNGCPVGDSRKKLSHYIGFLARDGHIMPLAVPNWKSMPDDRTEAAMREIKHIFEYPEMLDAKIKTKLNNSWKAHKSTMKKKGFDKNRSFEENLAHRPKDVLESQWAPLVTMWQDKQNQKLAAQNKENISKQTVHHTGGSKPHMEYAKELEATLGKFPDRLDIFQVTRTKKRKIKEQAVMDPLAAEQYARMVEIQKLASQPGSGVVLSGRIDAVSMVLGADKKGRVRCLGNTVKPKEFWGVEESSSKAVQLQSENDNLRQDLAMAADRILGLETDIAMLKNILISRDLLPPNPNNEGYEDLMVDMQGS